MNKEKFQQFLEIRKDIYFDKHDILGFIGIIELEMKLGAFDE